jgi:hypothetical protein
MKARRKPTGCVDTLAKRMRVDVCLANIPSAMGITRRRGFCGRRAKTFGASMTLTT